jgi:hypothetical protein
LLVVFQKRRRSCNRSKVTLALGSRSPENTSCHEDTSSRATDILIDDIISIDLPLQENTSCHENTSSRATGIRIDDTASADLPLEENTSCHENTSSRATGIHIDNTISIELASERKHFMLRRYFKHGNRHPYR